MVLVVFWMFARRREEPRAPAVDFGDPSAAVGEEKEPRDRAEPEPWRRHLSRCLPILLLSVDAMAGPYSVGRFLVGPGRILAAMLIGIAAAGLTSFRKSGGLAASFFDGAGYGYTHVISLIVVASTFAAGVELSGLIRLLLKAMSAWPKSALVAAPVGLVVPGVRGGDGDCAGGLDHGVLRSGRGIAGARSDPPGRCHLAGCPLTGAP